MNIDTENRDGILIVRLLGERLDASIVPEFRRDIFDRINDQVRSVVLNFESLEFIDSSGLAALVTILKCMGREGTVVVCNANDIVTQMFKLTRMDRIFLMTDSEEQALRRFSQ